MNADTLLGFGFATIVARRRIGRRRCKSKNNESYNKQTQYIMQNRQYEFPYRLRDGFLLILAV